MATKEDVHAALDSPEGRELLAQILLGQLLFDERIKERFSDLAVKSVDRFNADLTRDIELVEAQG